LNEKFGTSYTLGQVKQNEQDLKKDYRRVKDLLEQSGFGWNSDRMMVEAPESIWASFATLNEPSIGETSHSHIMTIYLSSMMVRLLCSLMSCL
jgi:hypothetical protein